MTAPVKIPADIDIEDRVLGPLTARQLAILAGTGLVVSLFWRASQPVLPLPVLVGCAAAMVGLVTLLVLGTRDGLSLDRLLLAAIRQWLQSRRRIAAAGHQQPVPDWITARATMSGRADSHPQPEGIGLPAHDVSEAGVVDLGREGLAMVAACSTVPLFLRTPTEQEALVGVFARWLHSLTTPAQLLVRTERLDVSGPISELDAQAPTLPHPALQAAAHEHADYLADLARSSTLLRRHVFLVLREPHPTGSSGSSGITTRLLRHGRTPQRRHSQAQRRAAEDRLARRITEAAELLHPAGITLTPLDAARASTVLARACNPDRLAPVTAATASAHDVITRPAAATDPHEEESA